MCLLFRGLTKLNKRDIKMLKKLFYKIKEKLNDIDYNRWETRIMSDALEFDIDEDTVEKWLDANYKNHYGKQS